MMKRRLFVLLFSLLLAILLAACSNSEENNGENIGATPENYSIANLGERNESVSYRAERINVPVEFINMAAYAFNDAKIYVCGIKITDGIEVVSLISMNLEGEVIAEFDYSEQLFEKMIHSIGIDVHSNVWAMESSSEYVTNSEGDVIGSDISFQLIKFNSDGQIADFVPVDKSLYPREMRVFGEYVHLVCPDKLIVLDLSGDKQFEVELTQPVNTAVSDKGFYMGEAIPAGYEVSVLNYETMQFNDKTRFDTEYRRISGFGNRLLIEDVTGIFLFDFSASQLEPLPINWTSVGLMGNYLELFELSGNRILYCAPDGVYVLRAEEISGNSDGSSGGTLVLATFDELMISRAVLQFNAENDNYKIEIEDYSKYNTNNDSSEGLTRLITEINSGRIPDIIDLTALPSELYNNNSLLEDLLPFIENDSNLSMSDFEIAAINAMMTEGRLLSLTPLYRILSVMGNTSDIAGYANSNDFIIGTHGNNAFGNTVSRYQMISYALGANNSKFYDFVTGECYFNTREFVDFLEFVKTLPETEDFYSYDANIASGNQRFYMQPVGSVGQIMAHRLYFGGSVDFIGLPFTRNGEALIIPVYSFGMASTSEHKDAAWEFLKLLVSDSFLENHCDSMFTLKTSMNNHAIQNVRNWHAMGGTFVYMIGNQEIETSITDETDIDLYIELLNSATGVFRHNEALFDIVMEEATEFFGGARSASQAAESIQGRVSIYMSERR